jgi:hypothetical protein
MVDRAFPAWIDAGGLTNFVKNASGYMRMDGKDVQIPLKFRYQVPESAAFLETEMDKHRRLAASVIAEEFHGDLKSTLVDLNRNKRLLQLVLKTAFPLSFRTDARLQDSVAECLEIFNSDQDWETLVDVKRSLVEDQWIRALWHLNSPDTSLSQENSILRCIEELEWIGLNDSTTYTTFEDKYRRLQGSIKALYNRFPEEDPLFTVTLGLAKQHISSGSFKRQ